MLKQYVAEAPVKQSGMDRYFENKDSKNYEILVHALKSTSRMIGASELSDKAKALEGYAKAGGDGITEVLHSGMMEMYKNTVKAIKEALGLDDTEAAQDSNESDIIEFSPENEENESVVLEFTPEESNS